MLTNKPALLLCIDWFHPAFKAGGPIIAAENFVHNMGHDFQIYVYTSNADLDSRNILDNITADVWTEWNGARVFYASSNNRSLRQLKNFINEIKPRYIYLHSMFSVKYSLIPLLLYRLRLTDAKIILAVRGMLKPSALQHKKIKKQLFLWTFKALKFTSNLTFQASNLAEQNDIQRNFGEKATILVAPDYPISPSKSFKRIVKNRGELTMIFISRIHPIKNLDFLLRVMKQIKTPISLTIVGNGEDDQYWKVCRSLIQENSLHTIEYKGSLPHHVAKDMYLDYHVFVLPTKGENFGHAIFEAFAAGRPALISDQTPWHNLEQKKAGWDLPLNSQAFTDVMHQIIQMDNEAFQTWCNGAWQFANDFTTKSDLKNQYLKLFC